MRYSLFTALLFLCQISFGQTVNSDDGRCYAKVMAPDKYDNVTEKVLVKAATNRSVKIPAVYDMVTERKEVAPASKKLNYVPAVYESITEEVINQPESVRIINIPAVFETVTEKVLVKEESSRLVVVPAKFQTVTESVEIKPATKSFEYIPAVYETATESVELSAASKRFIAIPAKYETMMEQVEIEAATVRIETIEPTFKVEEERVLIKPASTKWIETKGDKNCLSADPNDCIVWCLVEIPAEYKTVTRRINVGCDGSGNANSGCTKEIQVPAKYSQKSVKKLIEPATSREEEIPAQYSSVSKQILKTPAATREVEIPAQYASISKQQLVTPASTTKEIIPAVYKDVTKRKMVTPATTREEVIPATYKTITKRIIKTPARVDEEVIPAVYDNIAKRVLVTPESVDIQEIPAEYATVVKRVLINKGDLSWQRIVCPKHQTSQMNVELQQALKDAGYNVGPTDNIFGPQTYAAMVQYQKDNNLNYGHLDYETVAALGLTTLPDDVNIAGGPTQFALQAPTDSPAIAMTSKGGSNGGAASSSASNDNSNDSDNTANTMSAEELQMIAEINLMRSNPKAYVAFVEEHLKNVENDAGLGAAYKADELASGRELIQELKGMNPLPLIKANEGLHKVAKGHGDYVKSVGQIGHVGADGSYPWDRVRKGTDMKDGNENLVAGGGSVRESLMILLVDSGIAGRGHRKTLFNPKWTYGGIYKIGKVGDIPNGWIQVFGSK